MGPTIKRILFTTDLSDGSREAFKVAVSLANSCGASITLLHIIEEIPSGKKSILANYVGKEVFDEIENNNKEYAQNILIGKRKEVPIIKEALERMSQDSDYNAAGSSQSIKIDDIIVIIGKPVEEIITHTEDKSYDVIVMGNHRHGAIVEALMGGTTKGVMRRSKTPIFLVPIAN